MKAIKKEQNTTHKELQNWIIDDGIFEKSAFCNYYRGVSKQSPNKPIVLKEISLVTNSSEGTKPNIKSVQDEIQISTKFKHPNLIETYEVSIHGSNLFMIMEFCSQGTLKDFIEQK